MKRLFQYTAIVIALSLAASCNIIEEGTSETGLISFEPQAVKTKALVNPDNVTTQRFTVRDILNGTEYFNNSIAYSSGNWNYETTPATYYWKDGTHKFISYTKGSGAFDTTNKTWDIASMAITATANQTDLLYADTTVTAADWKNTTGHTKDTRVPLTFHHLLSALRITLVNASGENVSVTGASVTLPNTGSASVSFTGSAAAPSVSVVSGSNTFASFTSQTLSVGDSLDVLNGAKLSAAATPYVIWPQTLAAGKATITFSLAYGEGTATDMSVSIPAGTWTAGEVNNYRLVLYPEQVILQFEVKPWIKETIGLDTNDGSINMTNVSWMNTKVKLTQDATTIENTVVNSAYSVYMYNHPYIQNGTDWVEYDGYYPAQGFFTVNYPESGKFKIGLIPAYGETSVDEDMYEIYIYDPTATGYWRTQDTDGEDISRNTVYFQVRAASGQDGAQHKAQIDIWFLPDGSSEWISAYSEIRANYALVIPAV